ncbi:hypothetical protein LJR161_000218 [Variovorax paradoxus]|uniref:hypothetical protein n=1 Tax=Variovorax paradoxus TaxID=34073 RepID=UPI003ECC2CFB
MTEYENLSLYLSAISAFIALWAIVVSRRTAEEQRRIAQRMQELEERNLAATHYGKYSTLLYAVRSDVKASKDRLSDAAWQSMTRLHDLFDSLSNDQSVRPTRHIFDELCESIYRGFAPHLTQQSGSVLASRFAAMKYVEEQLDTLRNHRAEIQKRADHEVLDLRRIYKKDPDARLERLVLESARFQGGLLTLCDRFTEENRDKLLQAALRPVLEFVAVHDEERPKLVAAQQRLEQGLGKNELEEFQLRESQVLYAEYKREMAGIETLETLSLSEAKNLDGVRIKFVVGQLLYFGSLLYAMQMCNDWHIDA